MITRVTTQSPVMTIEHPQGFFLSYAGRGLGIFCIQLNLSFFFSRSELPDRGQDDAAQQSQVHGERRYWLRP